MVNWSVLWFVGCLVKQPDGYRKVSKLVGWLVGQGNSRLTHPLRTIFVAFDFVLFPFLIDPNSLDILATLLMNQCVSVCPLNNCSVTLMVGVRSKRNYRSVITRKEVEPPVCFNFSHRAVCLSAGREGKGLLMEIHSELIAGHYTTTGRDQRKEFNGRWRRALVNHYTHNTPQWRHHQWAPPHTHCPSSTHTTQPHTQIHTPHFSNVILFFYFWLFYHSRVCLRPY